MKDDIVKRLRNEHANDTLEMAAAREIEKLRAQVAALKEEIERRKA